MNDLAVIGAGSWGTALSVVLSHNGFGVDLFARNQTKAMYMNEFRENTTYLPGVKIPERVHVVSCFEDIKQAQTFVLAVPSHAVKETVEDICATVGHLRKLLFINTAKGFDPMTGQCMSLALKDTLKGHDFAVLSGPSHAEEVGMFLPSALVAASHDEAVSKRVQSLFMSERFRVYTNLDMIGIEIAGASKNVIAIAAGINAGLDFGDNSSAALVTRGLHEITRLGLAMGAQKETFYGLAGIGDLMVTCNSQHSRNRRCGYRLGKSESLEDILAGMGMVVEGVGATRLVKKLAEQYQVEMPITEEVYQVLFEKKDPETSVLALMKRAKKDETVIKTTDEEA